jgi:hypothetical protein
MDRPLHPEDDVRLPRVVRPLGMAVSMRVAPADLPLYWGARGWVTRAIAVLGRSEQAPGELRRRPAGGIGRTRVRRGPPLPSYPASMPVFLDLDNTLVDRDGAFSSWAARAVVGWGGDEGDVRWLVDADRSGYTPRRELAQMIQERLTPPCSADAIRPRGLGDAARGSPRRNGDRHGGADVRLHRGRARRAAVGIADPYGRMTADRVGRRRARQRAPSPPCRRTTEPAAARGSDPRCCAPAATRCPGTPAGSVDPGARRRSPCTGA